MDKKYFAVRDFKDAGTERAFAAGDEIKDVDAGGIGNYLAAGLITDEAPTSASTKTPAPAKAA